MQPKNNHRPRRLWPWAPSAEATPPPPIPPRSAIAAPHVRDAAAPAPVAARLGYATEPAEAAGPQSPLASKVEPRFARAAHAAVALGLANATRVLVQAGLPQTNAELVAASMAAGEVGELLGSRNDPRLERRLIDATGFLERRARARVRLAEERA